MCCFCPEGYTVFPFFPKKIFLLGDFKRRVVVFLVIIVMILNVALRDP